jgi:hypothetical protein
MDLFSNPHRTYKARHASNAVSSCGGGGGYTLIRVRGWKDSGETANAKVKITKVKAVEQV